MPSCRTPQRRMRRRPGGWRVQEFSTSSKVASGRYCVFRATLSTSHQVVSWCSAILSLASSRGPAENIVEEEHEGMFAFLPASRMALQKLTLLPPSVARSSTSKVARPRSLRLRCGRCGQSLGFFADILHRKGQPVRNPGGEGNARVSPRRDVEAFVPSRAVCLHREMSSTVRNRGKRSACACRYRQTGPARVK